jgi:hypothetical protein
VYTYLELELVDGLDPAVSNGLGDTRLDC